MAVTSYMPQKRAHVFAHDELVVKMARCLAKLDAVSCTYVLQELQTMRKFERGLREKLTDMVGREGVQL
jgi:hypothetical protein